MSVTGHRRNPRGRVVIETGSVHVWLQVRGGYAGRRLAAELDGDDLSGPDVAALTSAMSGPPAGDGRTDVPDLVHYELRVRMDGVLHTRSFTDLDLPPDLRPMVRRMLASGRPPG